MAFLLSKLLWALVSPGTLLTLTLLVAAGLAFSARPVWRRAGRIGCLVVAVCFASFAVLPVGEWALTPLENRFHFSPPEQVDGLIIIGGDEQPAITAARGMPVALDSLRRYVTFVELYRRYPEAKLVFAGGSGALHGASAVLDSEVARSFLTAVGVPTERMIFERSSRNTYENAEFSADIVRPEPGSKWLLVTSAWHMTRAMGCFRKAGWDVYAAPTGYATSGRYNLYLPLRFEEQLRMLTMATHEYVGLVSYWLMGRTSALWPG